MTCIKGDKITVRTIQYFGIRQQKQRITKQENHQHFAKKRDMRTVRHYGSNSMYILAYLFTHLIEGVNFISGK